MSTRERDRKRERGLRGEVKQRESESEEWNVRTQEEEGMRKV